MSFEWKTVDIESVCEGIFDGPHATPKKTTNGPVFLGISSLENGRLNLGNTEHLSEEDFTKWTKRVVPREGDIVFSYETRLGEVALIPADLRCCLGRRMALMRIDKSKALPEYVMYAYMSPMFQDVIRARTIHGSTVDRISLTAFGSFPISIPSLQIQHEIASTLQALDDRITLLHETNATLEVIAQALFKSWFVDFDPVRAKREGRAPEGMDAATAALFPDRFEESELGLVPSGWSTGTLADLVRLNPESWTTKTHPETVRYIDLANAKNNEIDVITKYAFDDAPSRARRVLRAGDSIIGTVRPGNRSFAYIYQASSNLTGSTGFAVLRPQEIKNTEFVFFAATQNSSIEHLAHVADGGAYPAVRPEVVANIETVLPSNDVMSAFHDVIGPILAGVGENQVRAQTLAELRDTLLPRLISGQLRLPEAETALADAALG